MLCVLLLSGVGAHSFAMPIQIDFSGETLGNKPNGYSVNGVPEVQFSTTEFEDLRVLGAGLECPNLPCLLVESDGTSALQIDLAFIADFISLGFGNDQPFFEPNVQDAALFLFLGANPVGEVIVPVNNNDLLDQVISFSGAGFDRAIFQYLGEGSVPARLAEVVDDIIIHRQAVPLPATLPLILFALAGLAFINLREKPLSR
ncbi:MAG: hypothetical protein HKN19_03845 [Halioglobus sp.]|nr:hypothetical protein [Halioglobus sp.]